MRATILLSVLAFAGCASAPPAPPAPPVAEAPKTVYVTPSGQAVAEVTDPNMDRKRLADAKRLGFRVINENGQTLFCRTEMSTGSRIVKNTDTKCQTPEAWDAERAANQAAMQQWKTNAPVQGR